MKDIDTFDTLVEEVKEEIQKKPTYQDNAQENITISFYPQWLYTEKAQLEAIKHRLEIKIHQQEQQELIDYDILDSLTTEYTFTVYELQTLEWQLRSYHAYQKDLQLQDQEDMIKWLLEKRRKIDTQREIKTYKKQHTVSRFFFSRELQHEFLTLLQNGYHLDNFGRRTHFVHLAYDNVSHTFDANPKHKINPFHEYKKLVAKHEITIDEKTGIANISRKGRQKIKEYEGKKEK